MDVQDLAFAGAAEQARMLAAGTITAPSLLEIYLDRIARLDPQLRSYRVVLADTARQEALAAQRRLDAGERLPLLGVPVAIKDDVDVAGELTPCGSSAVSTPAARDAEVVARLRAAGAVIIGKTSVPELMIFPFTEIADVRGDPQPVGHRAHAGRQQRRQRCRGGRRAGAAGAGLRRRRLDPHPVGLVRSVRDQAATRSGAAGAARRRVVRAERQRSARADGERRRAVPGCDDDDARPGRRIRRRRRASDPGRLRIALSTKVPPPLVANIGKEQRAAVDEAGELLRDLGHDVVVRDPDYPPAAIYANFLPRYFRGIYDDVRALPHQDRLEKRTRNMARIGSLFSDRRMATVRAGESAVAERIQSIFDDVDVVITPGNATGPSRIGAYQRRGGISSLLLVSQRVPFFEIWNLTGQPAAAVPWGLDRNGVPLSIQLVGRPMRRGDAAVAERADRGGQTVGAPATAGVMTARSPARPSSFWPGGIARAGLVDGNSW